MKISNFFEKLSTNGHLPVALFVFLIGSVVHWFKGLSGDYVAFTTTILTFLGAHAWTKEPDTPKPLPKEDPKI